MLAMVADKVMNQPNWDLIFAFICFILLKWMFSFQDSCPMDVTAPLEDKKASSSRKMWYFVLQQA